MMSVLIAYFSRIRSILPIFLMSAPLFCMEDRSLEQAYAVSVQLRDLFSEASLKNDPRLTLQWVVLRAFFFPISQSPESRLRDYARAACLGSLKIYTSDGVRELTNPFDFFVAYCAEMDMKWDDPLLEVRQKAFMDTCAKTHAIFFRFYLLQKIFSPKPS